MSTKFKLTELPPETSFFGLFVGDSGSGKTVAAASFPKPIHFLDIDKRIAGIRGAPFITPDGISLTRFQGDDILQELEDFFNSYEKSDPGYKTIVLDGFTSLAMMMLDGAFKLTAKMGDKNSGSNRRAQGHPKIGSVDIPGLEEYGYEQGGWKNVLTYLKYSIKCNVICTAHWRDTFDKDGTVNGQRINLRPAVLPSVLIWFDEVYYFEKQSLRQNVPGIGATDVLKYYVQFRSELARTTIPDLPNGKLDISQKPLYPEISKYLLRTNDEKLKIELVK